VLRVLKSDNLIGVSFGTAAVLGLVSAKIIEPPSTGHFLVGYGQCVEDCGFCSRARGSVGAPNRLSRVTWPEFPVDLVIDRVWPCIEKGLIRRVCIQIIEGTNSMSHAISFSKKVQELFKKSKRTPLISICASPYSISRVQVFLQNGASNVGLPIDGATPEVYEKVKKRDFNSAYRVTSEAAQKYPGKISTHLIIGLGESEEEAVKRIAHMLSRGLTVGLFAFTPVKGTELEGHRPPDIGSYRRIQICADFLKHGGSIDDIEFYDHRVIAVGKSHLSFHQQVLKGRPFRTSGCSFCNRPYYNERPGGTMYNYPRILTKQEIQKAVEESGLSYFFC
jgi:biotin synthase-related radical SAM superfamily protein